MGLEKEDIKYQIDTGVLFNLLKDNWKRIDREFLINTVWTAYKIVANYEEFGGKIDHEVLDTEVKKDIAIRKFNFQLKVSLEDDCFPFPDFCFIDRKNKVRYFSESYFIERGDENYDLFFALQISLSDFMSVSELLEFHFKSDFDSKFEEYDEFLENLFLKYKNSLLANLESLRFRMRNKFISNGSNFEIQNGIEKKEFTLARQVLMVHYLLKNLGISPDINKTEIARFIQFLTGKELNSKNIKNTNIYKKVGSPFSLTDKATQKDLQFIRSYFENLGLNDIVNQINAEINSNK